MPDSRTSESEFVCECGEWMREACAGEPFYRELEDKRYCVLHFPSKEKSADFKEALERKTKSRDFNFSGVWFPDEVSFFGFDFSSAADFRSATFSEAADFSGATFSALAYFRWTTFVAKANFRNTTFRDGVDLRWATFKGDANFIGGAFEASAHFSAVTFNAAEFIAATFSAEADFSFTTFSAIANFWGTSFSAGASFIGASFSAAANFVSATFTVEAYFSHATFGAKAEFSSAKFGSGASFDSATFSAGAYFGNARFSGAAYFRDAIFGNYVRFAGNEKKQPFGVTSSLDLQFARIEKPDRVSFHTLSLHPHWFINVDSRRFDFINIHWRNYGKAKEELKLLKRVPSCHRLLVITCRNLASNAEENDRFRSASQFRLMAMDAERLENWHGLDFRKLNWWYWFASGYGERVLRAFLVLLGIWFVAGLLYTRVGFARWEPKLASEVDAVVAKRDDVGTPLKFSRALTYSAAVMTFQKPEPRPATTAAQAIVFLETILGPVQAALLALAIRRKFMR